MKTIATLDAETDPFRAGRIPKPFVWGVYHEAEGETHFCYREFQHADEVIAYLIDKPWIVYAHNGGKFDYHFFLDYIPHGTPMTIINGRIAKFKIGECEFRDSYNLLPVGLGKMQKTKIDYAIFEPEERIKPHNRHLISEYLYDDCRFLYQYVKEFIDKYGLNLTLAGTAMKVWEGMIDDPAPNDFGGMIYKTYKRFYSGGRCQALQPGNHAGRFASYDVNSMYPHAMMQQHPISLDIEKVRFTDHRKTAEAFFDLPVATQGGVMMTVEAKSTGAFPYRADDMSLSFPDDKEPRTFHITGWEFLAALDTGTFCGQMVEFYIADGYTDFADYVMRFYEERQAAKAAGDNAGDLFAKLLMNSLYGKFGSNPDNYRSYITINPEMVEHDGSLSRGVELGVPGEWTYSGELGSLFLGERPLDENEQRFYNVLTAASITGHARAALWRAICAVRKAGGTVYYCDTDSMLVSHGHGDALDTGSELGQWKHEGDFLRAVIAGKKLYALEGIDGKWKIASKGARLTHTGIINIVNGQTVAYTPEAPTFSVHHQPRFVTRNLKRVDK